MASIFPRSVSVALTRSSLPVTRSASSKAFLQASSTRRRLSPRWGTWSFGRRPYCCSSSSANSSPSSISEGSRTRLGATAAAEIELLEQAGNGFQLVVGSGKTLRSPCPADCRRKNAARQSTPWPRSPRSRPHRCPRRVPAVTSCFWPRFSTAFRRSRRLAASSNSRLSAGGEHLSPQLLGHRLVISLQ